MSEDVDPIDINRRYQKNRQEIQRLRKEAHATSFDEIARFPVEGLLEVLREHDGRLDGDLIAFVANDFGMPIAFRPEGVEKERQNEVRLEILEEKYKSDDRMNTIREEIVDDVKIHKALVSLVNGDEIRYHLPGSTRGETNFVTVREAVGLVDFTTNANQHNCLQY